MHSNRPTSRRIITEKYLIILIYNALVFTINLRMTVRIARSTRTTTLQMPNSSAVVLPLRLRPDFPEVFDPFLLGIS